MRAYDAKHSDLHNIIKTPPIPTESRFVKFNAHQSYPLYGSTLHKLKALAYTYSIV